MRPSLRELRVAEEHVRHRQEATAVDDSVPASNVVPSSARQEESRVGDVLDLAESLKGNRHRLEAIALDTRSFVLTSLVRRCPIVHQLKVAKAFEALSTPDGPGHDSVDANVVGAPLNGHDFGQGVNARFSRR